MSSQMIIRRAFLSEASCVYRNQSVQTLASFHSVHGKYTGTPGQTETPFHSVQRKTQTLIHLAGPTESFGLQCKLFIASPISKCMRKISDVESKQTHTGMLCKSHNSFTVWREKHTLSQSHIWTDKITKMYRNYSILLAGGSESFKWVSSEALFIWSKIHCNIVKYHYNLR